MSDRERLRLEAVDREAGEQPGPGVVGAIGLDLATGEGRRWLAVVFWWTGPFGVQPVVLALPILLA